MSRLTIFVVTLLASRFALAAELSLDVTDLVAEKGRLYVAVFSDAKAFPGDAEKAILSKIVDVHQTSEHVVVGDLAPGKYAVSIMQDENGNGKMDFNFLGIPKEGFGFSNNPTVYFGPPSFNAAAIEVGASAVAVTIKTKHF